MDTPGLPVHDVAIAAPPQQVWDTMLDMIEAGVGYVQPGEPAPHGRGAVSHLPFVEGDPLVETVTGFEPPRIRRYKVEGEGTHLDLYDAAFVIEPDATGESSRLLWYVDFDDEPSEQGAEFITFAIEFIGRFLDQIQQRFT